MTDKKLIEALELVRGIISEGAITGFDCHNGDWAERLFKSQAVTSEALNTRQDTNSDEVREVLELLEMEAKKVKELRARERKLLGVLDVALGDYQEYKAAAILNELKALNTLPTTKSTEWIAVSERLPEYDLPTFYGVIEDLKDTYIKKKIYDLSNTEITIILNAFWQASTPPEAK